MGFIKSNWQAVAAMVALMAMVATFSGRIAALESDVTNLKLQAQVIESVDRRLSRIEGKLGIRGSE
jgi:hypothetical protein